ncbi:MAG TPA: hypothetical protein EYH45_04410 [Candidatus Caldiarchaeum subterraneum]|uniref:Uncharacterized protein n=1 Tax=Caldiarchaeum subterraneum TaxID=311458 RepID=A0A833EA13_CALS0|nr:hypothetical protein [Candidatus Caldarchaeum subterraneum]
MSAMLPSTNLFFILGFISLFLILFSEKIQWYGIVVVYLPAVYSLYLLVSEYDSTAFISLAAGYIVAFPIVILLSSIFSNLSGSIIIGFTSSYVAALTLLSAVVNGYATPEKLFIYIVRVFIQRIMGGAAGLFNNNEAPPVSPYLNILTALGMIAVILILFSLEDNKPIVKRSIKIERTPAVILLLATTLSLVSAHLVESFFNSSGLGIAVIGSLLFLAVALTSRKVR